MVKLIRLPGRRQRVAAEGGERTLWIVNQYAVPRAMPGITRHVELADLLREHGWATRIFAAAFHHTTATSIRPVSPVRASLDEIDGGIAFTWLWSSHYRRNGWKRYLNMATYTTTLLTSGVHRPAPDAVVGSSPHLLAGLGAWILARRYKVPFVFEVRDMWPDMLVQLGLTSPLVIRPLAALERFLYKRSDRIIALTDGIADRIAAKGVSRDKIQVIPNATLRPAPLDDTRRDAMRRQLGWNDRIVVVWAGSHNPMNGLDVVVEAARLLQDRDDILLAFIGDGSLKQDLKEQARGLPNVVFYDPVPKTEIGEWLRAADVGLIHSRRFEVFSGARPNKLFDYMAAGLAIVSTVPGEAWRLIQDAGAGISTVWEDPTALAAAIRSLAEAPEERRAMGRRGFEAVCQVHSREATAAELAALLDDVCADRAVNSKVRDIERVTSFGTAPVGAAREISPAGAIRRGDRNASAAD